MVASERYRTENSLRVCADFRPGMAACLLVAAGLMGLWTAPLPAHAQVVPSMGSFMAGSFVGTSGALSASMMQSMRQAADGAAIPRTPSAGSPDDTPPAPRQHLTFRPSPEVTDAVNRQLTEATTRKNADAGHRLGTLLASGRLQRTFAELLGKFGYSPDNIADVMTAYLILSWETVHNGDATRYPRGIQIVHQRVLHALAANPEIASISDAEKQKFSETLADMAMLSTTARKQLLQSGDTTRLKQLENNVRQTTLKLGIDVAALKLTSKGFVRTSF